jgi:hypothetical protein
MTQPPTLPELERKAARLEERLRQMARRGVRGAARDKVAFELEDVYRDIQDRNPKEGTQ